MPRLFTGIEIPHAIAAELSLKRGGIPGARWIDPENYHLTLRFMGDIDEETAGDIASSLALLRKPAFELRIDGLSWFGGRKPRALIATVAASQPLLELQAEQERIVQRFGLPPEGRKFTPHVTLARLEGASSRDVADYLASRGLFAAQTLPVERFVLFSARASTGGGPYVVEQPYPLRD